MQTTKKYRRIHGAILAHPWAIIPEWLDTICSIVAEHEGKSLDEIRAWVDAKMEVVDVKGTRVRRGQYAVQDGTAIIPLMGPIYPRANLATEMSGATSLEMFSNMFSSAMQNESVKNIFLQIDSPGGSVIGLDEAAQKVFNSREQSKPVIALADGMAASAAYYIGSQADKFYTTNSAIVGSIGVVSQIYDFSRQEANDGVDVTTIKTGSLKATGIGKVTDEQITEQKKIVGEYFNQFKAAVTRARPMANIDEVSTGAIWVGQKAVENKLCDGVSTMEEILADLAD